MSYEATTVCEGPAPGQGVGGTRRGPGLILEVEALPRRRVALERLSGSLTHDLNNQLAELVCDLDRLEEQDARGDEKAVIGHARRLTLQVVDQLRSLADYARPERDAAPREIELAAVVRRACQLARGVLHYHVSLELQLAPQLQVLARPQQLCQLLVTMLADLAGQRSQANLAVRLIGWGQQARLSLELSGGVPSERSSFDEGGGTSWPTEEDRRLASRIAAAHGGCLRVDRTGASLVLSLPLAQQASATSGGPGGPAGMAPTASERRGRVLVAEDQDGLARALQRLLGRDYELTIVATGRQARVLLERDPGYDALLVDLNLPELSGVELYRWLAERGTGLERRTLLMSGGPSSEEERVFVASHPEQYFEKPLDAKRLAATVARLVTAGPG